MDNNDKKQKNIERSIAYPALTLESAIAMALKLRDGLGKGPYSREEAAKAAGYSGISGASARAIAALVHYGLIERNGNTYSQSQNTEEILFPIDDTGFTKKQAIINAARTPKLFEKMIERFKGQSLPGLLENIFMKEGIAKNSAKEASLTFKETLQYSGILINGVIVLDSSENNTTNNPDNTFTKHEGVIAENSLLNRSLQFHTHNESGDGWMLSIKTNTPLTSEIKMKLIEVTELINNITTAK